MARRLHDGDHETVKVSCLMITGKTESHRRLAEVAVSCFLRQTYADKELLIVNTSPSRPWFRDRSPMIKEIGIHQGNSTLGDLRNRSYDEATGDLWLQWDDDDWHHPQRIAWQVANHRPGFCSILRRQYRVDLTSGDWGIVNATNWPRRGIVGTMLHEPTNWRYPSLEKAEDTAFISQFAHQHLINPQNNPPELYVRTYHGDNTWHRAKIMSPAQGKGHRKGDGVFVKSIRDLYAIPSEVA